MACPEKRGPIWAKNKPISQVSGVLESLGTKYEISVFLCFLYLSVRSWYDYFMTKLSLGKMRDLFCSLLTSSQPYSAQRESGSYFFTLLETRHELALQWAHFPTFLIKVFVYKSCLPAPQPAPFFNGAVNFAWNILVVSSNVVFSQRTTSNKQDFHFIKMRTFFLWEKEKKVKYNSV